MRARGFLFIIWAVPLSEAETRAKLIDPAIHACGWSEDMICRETTLGAVFSSNGHLFVEFDRPPA